MGELSGEFEGKVRFAKFDAGQDFELAAEHGVTGVPTVLVFEGGVKKDMIVGAKSKSHYRDTIQKHLAADDGF